MGSKIEDTFDSLRVSWFGSPEGLHIDSYKKIKSVDGYKINLINIEEDKIKKNNLDEDSKNKKKLWFVNLGGYEKNSMQEKHEFGLVVAKNSRDAKKIAKSKWLLGFTKIHKDNLFSFEIISDVDNCEVIQSIDNWRIDLTSEVDYKEEINSPDWFGYMRIDK